MKNFALLVLLTCVASGAYGADKKIVFVAGTPSHGPGEHEYRAGCLLLQKCLDHVRGIQTVVYSNGWPAAADAFDGADAIVLSMDGGAQCALLQDDHLKQIGALMDRGVGLGAIHWAVEVQKDKGEAEYLKWLGAAYEANWSVNPVWTANFAVLPQHPITQGVHPFEIKDEWYFHLRFVDGMKGVTPILYAIPPESTMSRPDGPHSGNPVVRAAVDRGEPAIVAWAYERPNGGRGFGFTGAHYHSNYGNENFRKVILNSILWIAKADVPPKGVQCKVSEEDLQQNLDVKGRRRFGR
jgi:type 1 glutamine amidotransferase